MELVGMLAVPPVQTGKSVAKHVDPEDMSERLCGFMCVQV